MSLETSIAALTTQAGLLLDLPAQITTTAQAQMALIGQTYQQRIAAMTTDFHVDQLLGLDTNSGTAALPLKSIQKAINLTPKGGVCMVRLQRDFLVAVDITVDNIRLYVTSASAVRYRFTFDRSFVNLTGVDYRRPFKFILSNSARLSFETLVLVVPTADGIYAPMNGTAFHAAIISSSWYNATAICMVSLSLCDIEIPASSFGQICAIGGDGQLLAWQENACTYTITAGNGKRFVGITNTAGTATGALPWLQTNLANI